MEDQKVFYSPRYSTVGACIRWLSRLPGEHPDEKEYYEINTFQIVPCGEDYCCVAVVWVLDMREKDELLASSVIELTDGS